MPLNPNEPFPIRPRLRDKKSYLGIRGYFITINAYQRRKYFVSPNVVSSMVRYLRYVSEDQHFDIVAYCFMPDHCHFVCTGRYETSDLLFFIKQYKQITGFNFTKMFQKPLWATSFYDRVLRAEEDIKGVGRYVLLNPVRGGLVKRVLDYPYNGSFVYPLAELVASDPVVLV